MTSSDSRHREWIVLAAILVLAAALRVSGLSWDLRHAPHEDEGYFVQNVGWMLAHHDLDHRYYQYPALFFYILLPVLAPFPAPEMGPGAYLAARGVVAAFGVASVALVYLLGRRLGVPGAGLAGALLLAVSPVEIFASHEVRPDVPLQTFGLAALIVFAGVGERLGGDVKAGLALAAATAIKFTGALLLPSYLAARLIARGPRLRGILWAGAGAFLAFFAFSPYFVLNPAGFLLGSQQQLGYHYVVRPRGDQGFGEMVLTYGIILRHALGTTGALLAAAGAARALRVDRRFWPAALLPVVTVAVFATNEVNRGRQLVPALGVVCLFAGYAVDALGRRSRAAAVMLALGAAVLPGAESARYAFGLRQPSSKDRALDWVDAHVPEGARVVTGVDGLGLDRSRYEVMPLGDALAARLRSEEAQAVVATEADLPAGLEVQARLPASEADGFPPLVVARAPAAAGPRAAPLVLAPGWIHASEADEQSAALLDGDLGTAWRTGPRQTPGQFLELRLPAPRTLTRVELVLGPRARTFSECLHVEVPGGEGWVRVPEVALRPEIDLQVGPERSQAIGFAPVSTDALRIVQCGRRGKPWGASELRVWAER